jgi:hypothetical protein
MNRIRWIAAVLACAAALSACRNVPPPHTPVPEPSKKPTQPMNPVNPSAVPPSR